MMLPLAKQNTSCRAARGRVWTALVLGMLALVVLFVLSGLFLTGQRQKQPVFVLGHTLFVVGSGSMEPAYQTGTLIVVKQEALDALQAGDVVVYRSVALGGSLAFHRITRFEDGGFYTKGDRNAIEDGQLITENSYVGKGVYQSYFLGAYLMCLKTPVGLIVFFLIPLFAVWVLADMIKRWGKRA